MGDPLRQNDDQERRFFTAQDRANAHWGIGAENDSLEGSDDETAKSARERADDAWGMTPEELRNKESGADAPTGENDANAAAERQRLADRSSSRASPLSSKALDALSVTPQGRLGKWATRFLKAFGNKRRTGIIGGVAGLVITVITLVVILTSPGIMVNHMRELILNRVSSVQVEHTKRYRRTHINKMSDLFSKDGRLGGPMIAEMEARGYRFRYDPADNNKVIGLETPDGLGLREGAIGEEIDAFMEQRHPLRTARWKTKRMNAFYRRYGISRTSIVAATDNAIDDPFREVNRRIARNALDDPARIDGQELTKLEGETDEQFEARKSMVAEAEGVSGAIGETRSRLIETGDDISEVARDVGFENADALNQLDEGVGEEVFRAASAVTDSSSLLSRGWAGLRNFLSPTEVLDKVCIVKNRLSLAALAARSTRSLSYMKYASTFIGVGDGVRTGKVDPHLLNSVMSRVTSADSHGNFFGASPGVDYALNGTFNKNRNNSFKSGYALDGKLTGTWAGIQNATDQIPGTTAAGCGVIQNVVFQVTTGVAVTAGKAIGCVATLGAVCGGSVAAQEAARQGVTAAVRASLQNSIRNLFTRQAARSVAIGVAAEIGFEAIMALTQMHIEKTLALPVHGQEQGAELGSVLIAGGGVANKQRSLASGMVPATTEQYAAVHAEHQKLKQQQREDMSIYARYFDINNIDSLAFNFAASLPIGYANVLNSTPSGLSTGINSLFTGGIFMSSLAQLTGATAYADDEVAFDAYEIERGPYSGKRTLAVDFAGTPQVYLPDEILNIDPLENITYLSQTLDSDNSTFIDPLTLEPNSQSFKDHLSNCVYAVDIISSIESADTSTPAKDCFAEHPVTKRFKAHLAYLDMVDGVEAEVLPESAAGESGAPAAATTQRAIKKIDDPLPTSGKIEPKGIIVHWWAGRANGNGIDTLAGVLRDRNLAVQFGILQNGEIYQLTANEDDKASHALGGNATTFGIELEGTPGDFGTQGVASNSEQFESAAWLIKYLSDKYQIPLASVPESDIVCGDVVGVHPHKALNKCGNTKTDVDDAYFNALMDRVRSM